MRATQKSSGLRNYKHIQNFLNSPDEEIQSNPNSSNISHIYDAQPPSIFTLQ